MSTPNHPFGGIPLHSLAPSGSFLQQLLEEINGPDTPTVLHNRHTTQRTPRSQPGAASSRRTSSMWVGGTSIAEDARKKLRAADEARLHRISVGGSDGAPDLERPTLHLRIPRSDTPIACLATNSTESSPGDPCLQPTASASGHAVPHNARLSRSRPASGGLRIPRLMRYFSEASTGPSEITTLESPPILSDPISATSKVTSPSEAPTSAISGTLTDTTTVTEGQYGSRSPGKRAISRSPSPELHLKKMRTVILPASGGRAMEQYHPGQHSGRSSIGGDNRCVIHNPTFTERAPMPLDHIGPISTDTMPELSSFRPQTADAQGMSHASIAPARPATRRSSMTIQDEYSEPAETPIWARSLHLVDMDVSIYKQSHGDDWKDHPLCLHCFRRHGSFNKIDEHGYEVCGRDEALESHYWQ